MNTKNPYSLPWIRALHSVVISNPDIPTATKQHLWAVLKTHPKKIGLSEPNDWCLNKAEVLMSEYYNTEEPLLKSLYTKEEDKAITALVHLVMSRLPAAHPHHQFCYSYLYYKSGKPNKNKRSANKLSHALLILAANGIRI